MTVASGIPGSERARRPRLPAGLRFLIASSFLIPFGSFMVLPFMSIFLHQRLGMSLGWVGFVLAAASLIQFSGGVVGGAVAERLGLKRTMVLALVVRTAGFALFLAVMAVPGAAVPALLLTACGAALYLPANKAYIVRSTDEERKPLFLSVSNSALNAGMAVGPLVAGLLILDAPLLVFGVTTGIFVVLTVCHVVMLAAEPTPTPTPTPTPEPVSGGRDGGGATGVAVLAEAARTALTAPFLVNLLTIYVYMFFQNYMGVFTAAHHSPEVYSLLLLLNAGGVIVLQPVAAKAIGRLAYRWAIGLSFVAFGAGMAVVAQAGLVALFLGTALVTLGEVVLFLKNELAALDRMPDRPALAFGQQRLAAGIGAFVSGVVGGQLYELAERSGGDRWFWIAAAAQCALVALVGVVVVRR
ncbi:Major Facilitator Superfamily protein [Streptoalloteichus tenebrarius]|uniref:Major Facilitator Superfamily protein n=1 Tax=Streptoalloteichus tenebrarius (strain ATCC 17920 / DSM 40477 / JCM 4838 / CBS 697.72 / NBRC 16177 / NCIMB 11028 / NRRL B-12390 / A12253. 1 / ISP 5477) TaxID=1933 RepID=A0ABT1HQP7_STRSD|nr:MFS transporter [Streptoalloteichus tenebrarius]MCP2257837.1 Major Facilitator Superfamily protein [Streptoalloteichus tenebrarius]BFE99801.1 MFS transporter [Streptoalloteichus tenebrarius]